MQNLYKAGDIEIHDQKGSMFGNGDLIADNYKHIIDIKLFKDILMGLNEEKILKKYTKLITIQMLK